MSTSAYKFTITGITPILLHNNNILERDVLEAKRKKMKGGKPGDDRSPPESWKGYNYFSEETGNVCMPAENMLACLLLGGVKVKVGGKETLKTHSQRVMFDQVDFDMLIQGKPITRASIDAIQGEFSEHYKAAQDLGFKLHVKPCTVGTSKHIRVRPQFGGWSFSGTFLIDEEDATVLSLTALRDLFSTCGRMVGLGDWRPGSPKRPGQWGRFMAEVNRI